MKTRLPSATRPVCLVRAATLLLLVAAPRLLAAQEVDVTRLSEEEREKLRMVRPAEVPAPAGRDPLPLDSLRPGVRVVMSARDVGANRQGVIAAIPARDTLIFDDLRTRALLRVPVDRVSFMAVSTGRAPAGGRSTMGAALGAVAGLAVAVGVDLVANRGEGCHGRFERPACGDLASFPALSGMFVGAGVGWAVGARMRGGPGPHRWRLVSLPAPR